ncbi:hypothetical protein A2715_01240 [Candidatus Woesebacteria bacterium RIFCSPHIGHO2_01_FULL_39_32]|uniref:Transcobalamin-like C-terminal domain-containing protein n=1 Tax=Candidatus Woesebacteria bacterium RIFCSPLOWO2_01_FULL_39_25 TaxID=1802521 RepID=A0A1F8BKP5_9BACT|nr:MAG: hypothetical protein A2124_05200 [Candidatus Woesebacteria bacterium GWB1_37_5]OGM24531.1 MAG: hypothetical protein A2715_01240 [Candidatus Woesebacteria bacterium RIFCSPHIGHO2_01_FULL_39_32]OGM38841.1 MAG: hypothetical protein A3F01_03625 [Candidatus Woesebacteria bacterium RIFCSPHIGHO2_12_FULL_38_11]OGM63838.1 MAG: hypothetical protein A2893_02575 [Candidatus Woesebacteria bacterium RIFCSPLOWO2_01_FULL_39_25]
MNKKFFLFVLAAAGVILTAFFLIPKYQPTQLPVATPTPEISLKSATLVIDYGEDNPSTYSIELTNDSTALSVLKSISEKENVPLETQQYDFGVFVKSIGGKASSAETAWIYFVNGESGTIAADQMKINPADTVEWKYILLSEE